MGLQSQTTFFSIVCCGTLGEFLNASQSQGTLFGFQAGRWWELPWWKSRRHVYVHGSLIVILGVTSDIFKINLLINKIMCFQLTRWKQGPSKPRAQKKEGINEKMTESSCLQYFEKPFVLVFYVCVMISQTQWLKTAPTYELRVLLVRCLVCRGCLAGLPAQSISKLKPKCQLDRVLICRLWGKIFFQYHS